MKINSIQISDWPEGPEKKIEGTQCNPISKHIWAYMFSPKSVGEAVSV